MGVLKYKKYYTKRMYKLYDEHLFKSMDHFRDKYTLPLGHHNHMGHRI